MSIQIPCGCCGSSCTPLPLPSNTIIVNANDDCSSFSTVKDALATVVADGFMVYVLSDTTEPDINTTLQYSGSIVFKDDVTVTHTSFETFIIVDAGKTLNIYNGLVNGSGDSIGVYEIYDGNLNIYGHRAFAGANGGHCLYPSAGNLYVENSYFTCSGNDTMRVPATITSFVSRKSILECGSSNSTHEAIDDNSAASVYYDIQDSIVSSAGGAAMNFLNIPSNGATAALSSRFIRNTLTAGVGAGVYTVVSNAVWNPAYFSMNTLYQGVSGTFNPNITLFAGLTNDVA